MRIKNYLTDGWLWAEAGISFRKLRDMDIQFLETTEELTSVEIANSQVSFVSFLSEVPAPLKAAMTCFIEEHPNWDQYRLVQAAFSGFLVQNGIESRAITRLYLDNMFSRKSSEQDSELGK